MKKVAIIGTVGIPAKYGGFETLVEHLTKQLSKDYEMSVYCSSHSYSEKLYTYNGATLKYINLKANGIQSIPYDIVSIIRSCRTADTLLILGVSGCMILPLVKYFSTKKIIVNIDGLEWKRDKWNKYAKWFLKFSEKQAVKYADIVVSDNKVIQDYIKEEYGRDSVYIAYGADHVSKEIMSDEIKVKYSFLNKKYAFNVCRIEPENNLHLILEAFKEYRDLNLVIIGNWSNSEYGINLKAKYGEIKNINLIDPIYDQKILNEIRSNCYVYIHGHSAGGTNPSLIEAMYLKLPIFAYAISYNKETTDNKAFYFNSKNELIKLLENINEDVLYKNACNMSEYALKDYIWNNISNKYLKLF